MKRILKCRLCSSTLPNTSVLFQDQFVSNFVTENDVLSGIKVPIELVICSECTLVQQCYSAPQDFLYSQNYWYRSGVTETMRSQLRDIVSSCFEEVLMSESDVMLDIGANDGTMLGFAKDKCITVGIDPAKNLFESLQKNCDYSANSFWNAEAYFQLARESALPKPKIVTAIGMFYDLEDPLSFVRDIFETMHDDGIFVAQLMTLEPMLKKNDLGNLCHEHLEFYTYNSLVYLFEESGLEIFKVTENETNGGSYRIFARKFKTGSINYSQMIDYRNIDEFKSRIDNIGRELRQLLVNIASEGKSVQVLGASTKGNCILQYFNIDKTLISFASERSPEKYGLYTIGSGLKIISEAESRALNPDYYLILPWAFKDEIVSREEVFRSKGGNFIVPFPDLQVI